MKKLKQSIIVCFMLVVPITLSSTVHQSHISFTTSNVWAGTQPDFNAHDLKILLQKLQQSIADLHDLDDMKTTGMSQADIQHLKNTLQQKIKNMMDDAIDMSKQLSQGEKHAH